MGQKVNPISFRLIRRKNWRSKWYANKKEFSKFLEEDRQIREYLMKKPCCVGTSKILISRMSGKVEVTISTARPGLVIGKKGAEIDALKKELSKLKKEGDTVWSIYSTDDDVELSNARNDVCSALSGDTRLVYRQTHGRMVVARQPIKQGSIESFRQKVHFAF